MVVRSRSVSSSSGRAWVGRFLRRNAGSGKTAFQILVASKPERLRPGYADIWDSNKIVSSESLNIHYGGPTPKARQRGYWTVRVRGKDGRPSSFAQRRVVGDGALWRRVDGKWIGCPSAATEPRSTHARSVVYVRKPFVIVVPAAAVLRGPRRAFFKDIGGARLTPSTSSPTDTDLGLEASPSRKQARPDASGLRALGQRRGVASVCKSLASMRFQYRKTIELLPRK
jgi:hypothetical protein